MFYVCFWNEGIRPVGAMNTHAVTHAAHKEEGARPEAPLGCALAAGAHPGWLLALTRSSCMRQLGILTRIDRPRDSMLLGSVLLSQAICPCPSTVSVRRARRARPARDSVCLPCCCPAVLQLCLTRQ